MVRSVSSQQNDTTMKLTFDPLNTKLRIFFYTVVGLCKIGTLLYGVCDVFCEITPTLTFRSPLSYQFIVPYRYVSDGMKLPLAVPYLEVLLLSQVCEVTVSLNQNLNHLIISESRGMSDSLHHFDH